MFDYNFCASFAVKVRFARQADLIFCQAVIFMSVKEFNERVNQMKPNEMLSVLLKAMGILMLVWSLGVLANCAVSVVQSLSSQYVSTGFEILRFFANCIYFIGSIAMIIGSKFVASRIDKIEVPEK